MSREGDLMRKALKRHLIPALASTEADDARDVFAGFSFEGFGEDLSKYEALAIRVASLLPQVDAWLTQGDKGPNIDAF